MKIAILLASVFSCTQVYATQVSLKGPLSISQGRIINPTFSFIPGLNSPNTCFLQWRLASTTGVKKFMVESTYEYPTDPYTQWQTIGLIIPLNNSISKFRNDGLLPGIINYRITALANDNSGVVSDIFTTTIQ